MPKYTFTCEKCGESFQKYTPRLVVETPCETCGNAVNAHRRVPTLSGPAEVKELADSYTGVYLPPDNASLLQERKLDYFWKEMVPRLVEDHSEEDAIRNGWAFYDEKGQFRVHDKPPHRR